MILASKVLNIPQTDFVKSFEIIIQSGAILSVIVLYTKTVLSNPNLFKKTIIAFIPTGIIGLTLYRIIKDILIGNIIITLISLLIGGVLIIAIELYFKSKSQVTPTVARQRPRLLPGGNEQDNHTKTLENLTYKQALIIGIFQSISIIPGVSRAAATIIGGLFTGLNRSSAVEFSFLLAIPTMLAATGYDLLKNASSFSPDQAKILALGFFASFMTSFIVVRWFLSFIKNHTFIPFGIYRIALAILFFLLFLR